MLKGNLSWGNLAAATQSTSSLGRPLDPRYKTNLLILILAVVAGMAGVGVALYDQRGPIVAIGIGLLAGMLTVLTWALARELDPQHDYAAFVGLLPAVIAFFLSGDSALWTLLLLLLLARVVVRSVGPPALYTDSLVVLVITGIGVFGFQSWSLGIIAAVGFALDAVLVHPQRWQSAFGLVALALTGIYALSTDVDPLSLPTGWHLIIPTIILVGFAVRIARTNAVPVTSDQGDERLSVQRVQSAMSLTLLASILLALAGGNQAVIETAALWSAMGGIVLYHAGSKVLKQS